MPRHQARIPSPWDPERVVAYPADVSDAAEWDPGIVRASTATGGGVEPGTAFDLVVSSVGPEMPLRYVVARREPLRITFKALTPPIESEDTITVTPDTGGSIAEYDGRLSLRGPTRLLDPLLGPARTRVTPSCSSAAHRLARTAGSDTEERRNGLLDECLRMYGLPAPPVAPSPA